MTREENNNKGWIEQRTEAGLVRFAVSVRYKWLEINRVLGMKLNFDPLYQDLPMQYIAEFHT